MEDNVGRMISFNGSNCSTWKTKIEDLLYSKDQYVPIEGEVCRPKDISDAEWKITNRKTIATIRMWMDENVFHQGYLLVWSEKYKEGTN